MLFISIMLVVWFGFWLYFTVKKYNCSAAIVCLLAEMFDIDDEEDEEEERSE